MSSAGKSSQTSSNSDRHFDGASTLYSPLSGRPSPLAHARDVLNRRALVASDITVAAATIWGSLMVVGSDHLRPLGILFLLPVPLLAKLLGLYDNDDTKLRHTTLDEAPRILALALSVVVMIWLTQRSVIHGPIGHGQRAGMVLILLFGLIVGRGVTRRLITRALPPERCIVAGSSADSTELAERFERSRTFKARVVAQIEPELSGAESYFEEQDALLELVRSHEAERIIVIPREASNLEVARAANAIGIKVSVIPRLFDTVGASFAVDDLIGLTMLGMRRPRLSGSSAVIKRMTDIVLGSVIAVVLAPFMVLMALAIKLDSPGPAIYRQRRVGKGELTFTIFKFRSMTDNSHSHRSHLKRLNESTGLFKITDDPRVTRVGRLLRKTSLDELPQIFNVLRGDMSLVGPRPLVPEEDMLLDGWARFRYRVLPGMTGPWQLGTAARFSIEDMASLDYVYVTNWSLWTDVKILIRTVVYVLGLHGR